MNANLPTPSNIAVEQDDHCAILSWNGFPKTVAPGVTGWAVSWSATGQPIQTSYVEAATVQLQPLVNGTPYIAFIRPIDQLGNIGPTSAPISFTGDSSRVDTLRKQMNGFFDDFNIPAGSVDPLKWNFAVSAVNAPMMNGFFVNDQFHVHSMLASDINDRGNVCSTPFVPLILTDGGTRTICFDLDGGQDRDTWYMDLTPDLDGLYLIGDISFQANPSYPGNSVRIRQEGNTVRIIWRDGNGLSHTLADNPNLLAQDIQLVHNVRRHWRITVSQKRVGVFINEVKVASAPVSIPWTQGSVHWTAFSYNTPKENCRNALLHWDNFGFDAPPGWTPPTVVHNYRPANDLALNWLKASYVITIPDDLTNASEACVCFTMQCKNLGVYAYGATDTLTVNGQVFDILPPSGYYLKTNQLCSDVIPYPACITLPLRTLVQGDNIIEFNFFQCGVLNVHCEVTYTAGQQPAYTPPPHMDMPPMPPMGPSVRMMALNGNLLLIGGHYDPNAPPLPVNGTITLDVKVNGRVALHSTGKTAGIQRVELLVNRQIVQTINTAADVLALAGNYTFTLDTTTLPNAIHEITVQAWGPTELPSTPDYPTAYGAAGQYYPIKLSVTNVLSTPS